MEQIGMDELNKGIQAVIHNPDIIQITFKKFSDEKEHYYEIQKVLISIRVKILQ